MVAARDESVNRRRRLVHGSRHGLAQLAASQGCEQPLDVADDLPCRRQEPPLLARLVLVNDALDELRDVCGWWPQLGSSWWVLPSARISSSRTADARRPTPPSLCLVPPRHPLARLLTSKLSLTHPQNPSHPHPASRANSPSTSSAHSASHAFVPSDSIVSPSRALISGSTSVMLSAHRACDARRAA